ncbi:MAG: hypothetical protein RLO80_12180 [Hyphomonas sp.]
MKLFFKLLGAISFVSALLGLIVLGRDELIGLFDPDSRVATVGDIRKIMQDEIDKELAPENQAGLDSDRRALRDKAVGQLIERSPEAAQHIAGGRLAEGFDLLEKEAHASTASAAREWREIGALAFDAQPQRALEAYRMATSLDDTDCWAWIFLARLEARQAGRSAEAGRAAKEAFRVAKSDRERNKALNEISRMQLRSGNLAAARTASEQSVIVARAMVIANPSTEAKRDLSISLERLADVALKENDLVTAREVIDESLAIRRVLVAANLQSTEAQRDLSFALNKLGDLAVSVDDFGTAQRAFQESLEIRRVLAIADPASAIAKRDLSSSLERLGELAMKRNNMNVARNAFEENLEIRRALAETNPNSAQAKLDLTFALNNLGDVAMMALDYKSARKAYQEGLKIRSELAASDPESVQAQKDLLVSKQKIGLTELKSGNMDEAKVFLTEVVTGLKALVERDPARADHEVDLAVSYNWLGHATGDVQHSAAADAIEERLASANRLSPDGAKAIRDARNYVRPI